LVLDWEHKFYVGNTCFYGSSSTVNSSLGNVGETGHFDIPFADGDSPDQDLYSEREVEESDDAVESYFNLHEQVDNADFYTCIKQGFDDIECDLNDDEEFGVDYVPTTNAGCVPIYSELNGPTYSNAAFGNHVILNHYGHMLIRRKGACSGTLSQRHFLQRLVGCYPGKSIPLVYPEAMLFPDLFYTDRNGTDLVGAVPAALLHDDRWLRANGFESLQNHFQNRLSHPGLLTSSNPKYHFFAFDALCNLGLRGCDSRIILRRGFAELQGQGGVAFRGSEHPLFDTEQVDCRPMVNKLAAACAERKPTYFLTWTCSMRTHFGMKVIWDWLVSDDLYSLVARGDESNEEREQLKQAVINSAGVLLLRAWMEIIHIWIVYITKSGEEPMGKILHYCVRAEQQDGDKPVFKPKGNLPHLHGLFWTADDLSTEEGLATALDRIRGFILDIMREDEREQYVRDGILPDNAAVVRFHEMAHSMLNHKHTRRCFFLKRDQDSEIETVKLKCKANDNFICNPSPGEHSFCPINIEHTDDCLQVLKEVELIEVSDLGEMIPLCDCLKAEKHYPPAHGNEGIIQPVIGALFSRNPNMSNVQHPTGYTLNRYLTKYILTIDLYNTITITPPRSDGSQNEALHYQLEATELPNQKITSNRYYQQQQQHIDDKSLNSGHTVKQQRGRAFNITEFYMMLYGYAPVMTNIKFVKLVSKPYEERGARERRRKPIEALRNNETLQGQALSAVNCVASHKVRNQSSVLTPFPLWRQFTATQISVIEDDLESPLFVNPVTLFSIRPPELRFVMEQKPFLRWFKRTPFVGNLEEQLGYCEQQLNSHDICFSAWIDGQTGHLRIRKMGIPEIVTYINTCPIQDFGGLQGKQLTLTHFQLLENATSAVLPTPIQRYLLGKFVCELDENALPTVWMDSVRPTRTNHFLIHILLSMGSFVDEYSLFCHPTLRECFIYARLLDPLAPDHSAKVLTKQYILDQLSRLPAGTPTFDRYVVAAYRSFLTLFESNQMFSDDIPPVLYCHLRNVTSDKIENYHSTLRQNLAKSLTQKLTAAGIPNVPSADQCVAAKLGSPCPFDIATIPRSNEQPILSYQEQRELLCTAKHLIHNYMDAPTVCTKNLCIAGGPGAGKTTCLFSILLYSMCQGLSVILTALLAERAQELGGIHIHELFCFPVNEKLSPGQLAERAIGTLFRNPEKCELIRRVDVVGIDELGPIPSELLSALDIVFRYIRTSNMPFGGARLEVSVDHKQIDPINGSHPLLSPLLCSSFLFRMLKHSVRAAQDARWQRIQNISRMEPFELTQEGVRHEFVSLFLQTCTFVRTLDDPKIPTDVLFAFGKHAPIRKQEKRVLDILIHNRGTEHIISHAEDKERNISGTFQPASTTTSNFLDKKVKEPRRLLFFPRGRYQITYNKIAHFSTSQLAILFDLPTQAQVDDKRPVSCWWLLLVVALFPMSPAQKKIFLVKVGLNK
jgi:hypothetical protein